MRTGLVVNRAHTVPFVFLCQPNGLLPSNLSEVFGCTLFPVLQNGLSKVSDRKGYLKEVVKTASFINRGICSVSVLKNGKKPPYMVSSAPLSERHATALVSHLPVTLSVDSVLRN